jgi:hypothetical protein
MALPNHKLPFRLVQLRMEESRYDRRDVSPAIEPAITTLHILHVEFETISVRTRRVLAWTHFHSSAWQQPADVPPALKYFGHSQQIKLDLLHLSGSRCIGSLQGLGV